jgi:hypothetical protein
MGDDLTVGLISPVLITVYSTVWTVLSTDQLLDCHSSDGITISVSCYP